MNQFILLFFVVWDFAHFVFDLIKNSLGKYGIKVVQIGAKENTIIPNIDACYGDLTFKQNAYILSKSLLSLMYISTNLVII